VEEAVGVDARLARVPGRRPASFSLFRDDYFNRVLARLGLGDSKPWGPVIRILTIVGLSWGVPAAFAWWKRPELGTFSREFFFYDIANWAQCAVFMPFAIGAEPYIDDKMRTAMRHLRIVAPRGDLRSLMTRAATLSRSWIAEAVCLALAYIFTWSWALDEVTNGQASWHTEVTAAGERFTAAGWWVALFSLPLFTFLWLRWVWKIGTWTWLLHGVSRLRLRLYPAHPDRTGGLGCLSDVQTSFALLLFGTGILFAAFVGYKIRLEGTSVTSRTVLGPVIGYILLAPAAFLAPLFLFTSTLHRTKREALLRYSALGAALTRRFEQRWLYDSRRGADILETSGHSALADFRANFEIVERMRVVPFDARSVIELFGSAAGPFVPLANLLDIPAKVRAILELLS
jgi:hypothetical protein